MPNTWQSLYLCCADVSTEHVVTTLQESLQALGYELYDPFGFTPGKAFPQVVRLFVTPPADGWTRIIGTPDERLLPALSQLGTCLSLTLSSTDGQISTFIDGASADPVSALTPYLQQARTSHDLQQALSGEAGDFEDTASPGNIPLNALPPDVQEMAKDLNPGQMDNLFGKLMGRFGGQLSGEISAGRQLLESAPDWNSVWGKRIRAMMHCLTIPDPYWHTPDFITLRDAFQLHRRRQRNPNAALYPGDAEALSAVPDALDYTPVYGGMTP